MDNSGHPQAYPQSGDVVACSRPGIHPDCPWPYTSRANACSAMGTPAVVYARATEAQRLVECGDISECTFLSGGAFALARSARCLRVRVSKGVFRRVMQWPTGSRRGLCDVANRQSAGRIPHHFTASLGRWSGCSPSQFLKAPFETRTASHAHAASSALGDVRGAWK